MARTTTTPITTRRLSANATTHAAPVWQSYLSARAPSDVSLVAIPRCRKRSKPTRSTTSSTVVATEPFASDPTVGWRIRAYWEALSVTERSQVLFVDEPELVTQLYKLNLSLLCVGLMQRHLKAPRRATSGCANASTTSQVREPEAADEKAFELLEAMEFMDLGTGILTMKSELVEDPERLFALAGAVLHGFLGSPFVLPEQQFHDLFVKESDVINTWEDYERLIAMLVEQLILRSYVAHLEKEAADQMEALLREVSLADDDPQSALGLSSTRKSTKKTKKKTKKKAKMTMKSSGSKAPATPLETSPVKPSCDSVCHMDLMDAETPTESESEPDTDGDSLQLLVETEGEAVVREDTVPASSRPALNPDAVEFLPAAARNVEPQKATGKRKLDDFILRVAWHDVQDDEEEDEEDAAWGDGSADFVCRNGEQNAELECHLQYIYASGSAMYGWDFKRRREVDVPACGPWSHALWQTAPQDVVRYYFPPTPSTGRPPSGPAFGAPLLPGLVLPAGACDGVHPSLQSPFPVPPIGQQWMPADVPPPSSRYFYSPPPDAPPVSFWDPSVGLGEAPAFQ
ncbi:hypothetical protein P43SY_003897 [Pythium insidiosum]|uniref:Uncharacterized protein n=1 Tax=Pythium insidiosum TaxID=114742 RepID=A0AAD5LMG3_PYTIN|nr:hypothetical protein P43SY_003897 [Pythium insidiosum]